MNIALCCDGNYVMPCLVTITSFFENNKDTECNVYVLTDDLTSYNEQRFQHLAEIYQQKIIVTKVDINTYSNLKVRDRYPKAMYYRFLLPSIMKDEDKVLYLDCDIIVRHSLNELFYIDLKDYSCAVVEDAQCDSTWLRTRIKYLDKYFNSGVMLMNLNYWRKHCTTDTLIKFIEENPERCFYPDQDALNICLDGTLLYLEYTYNFQQIWYSETNNNFLFSKADSILQYKKNPIILHFTFTEKPWHKECYHPLQNEWLKYATKYDFIKCKITYKHNFIYRLMTLLQMPFEYIKVHYGK